MSTRDEARLTAQERAALSSLEALATAHDPQLAARLQGPGRWSVAVWSARTAAVFKWARAPEKLLSLRFAIPVVVLGLALVVAGVSVGWGLGVVGALLTAGGLTSLVVYAGRRLGRRPGS